MKAKKLAYTTIAMIGLNLVAPFTIHADTMEDLNKQEQQVFQESQMLSSDVQSALVDANKTYQKVDKLKSQIAENQQTLEEVTTEISQKQGTIERRKQVMAERLRSLQTNQVSDNKLEILLSATSVQDFVNKMYAINVMQTSEKRNFENLNNAVNQLRELKNKAETTQKSLEVSQASLQVEAKNLDEKVSALKGQLAGKQEILQHITASKTAEESRLKEEAERVAKEKEAQAVAAKQAADAAAASQSAAQQAQAASSVSTASTSTSTPETNVTTPPQETKPPMGTTTGQGRVIYVQSTAYSYAETGHSITATGLDLRKTPMAIAVDPRVIPLGSFVEVEGYGLAIAADTGGAIKGNIVDVHFRTVAEAKQWGRKFNVKVTILS